MSEKGAPGTQLSPELFEDGADRRRHPRVPVNLGVRLGPPGGEPGSMLIAEDLSAGGVFIKCQQAAKVGAGFSAELVLEDGERLYVSNAEVVYNRLGDDVAGFGARFVDLPGDVQQRLLERAVFPSDIRSPKSAAAIPTDPVARETERPSPSIIETTDSMIVPSEELPSVRPVQAKRAAPPGAEAHSRSEERAEASWQDWAPEVSGSMIVGASSMIVSTRPSVIRAPLTAIPGKKRTPPQIVLDVTQFPEPKCRTSDLKLPSDGPHATDLGTAALDDELLEAPELVLNHAETRVPFGPTPVRHMSILERALASRHRPWVAGGIGAAAGLLLVVAITLATRGEPEVEAAPPTPGPTGLTAETRAVLDAKEPTSIAVKPTAPAPQAVVNAEEPPKNPLPPLVKVEEVIEKKAEPPPPKPEMIEPTAPEAPKPAVAAKKPVEKPAKKAETLTSSLQSAAKAKPTHELILGVSRTTRVVKTQVLHKPDRFVIDLSGLSGAPQVPKQAKSRVRVGQHPGYTRVVVDSPSKLDRAQAVMAGDELRIRLYR